MAPCDETGPHWLLAAGRGQGVCVRGLKRCLVCFSFQIWVSGLHWAFLDTGTDSVDALCFACLSGVIRGTVRSL